MIGQLIQGEVPVISQESNAVGTGKAFGVPVRAQSAGEKFANWSYEFGVAPTAISVQLLGAMERNATTDALIDAQVLDTYATPGTPTTRIITVGKYRFLAGRVDTLTLGPGTLIKVKIGV